MLPDINLASGAWHDVYAASGIAPGTPILILNKGGSNVYMWEGAAQPAASSWDGVQFFGEPWVADQVGVSGCWVKSMAAVLINVQVYTL